MRMYITMITGYISIQDRIINMCIQSDSSLHGVPVRLAPSMTPVSATRIGLWLAGIVRNVSEELTKYGTRHSIQRGIAFYVMMLIGPGFRY